MSSPRVVVITGASGGLGQALTRLHLEKGDLVIAATRKPVNHESLTTPVPDSNRFFSYTVNVGNNEDVRRFAAWVHVRFGRCDILYNNAGIAVFEPLIGMDIDELEETLRTNIAGVMYTTRAFLPLMLDCGSGHIVNVASLAGQVATAKASVYAASKAAVIRFSEGLQHELAGSGVRVTCAMPGPIDTPFLEKADRTGAYRSKVARYLLSADETARHIYKAVQANRSEVAVPYRLKMLSVLYALLPQRIKQLVAPLLNRK
ncbi:SDR family NAD(P)-dependent oxidoreductase [Brevibacillus agri]|uniref:SDR family NAD(P)-dependent oxidoreductase n=1 Tax=Brevibacillus agri TaxID=51101 RepID=UPI002E1C8C46|nr:SDR family NAD(P)-dependent oxidoreductase [Brevibacillus agri]